jgi:hypothetical protein
MKKKEDCSCTRVFFCVSCLLLPQLPLSLSSFFFMRVHVEETLSSSRLPLFLLLVSGE